MSAMAQVLSEKEALIQRLERELLRTKQREALFAQRSAAAVSIDRGVWEEAVSRLDSVQTCLRGMQQMSNDLCTEMAEIRSTLLAAAPVSGSRLGM